MNGSRLAGSLDDQVRKIAVDMPESMIAKVDMAAKTEGLQRASFVRHIVTQYIEGHLLDYSAVFQLALIFGSSERNITGESS